jgi:hypothetical protein
MRTGVHGPTDNDLGGNMLKGMKRYNGKYSPFAGLAFGMLCNAPEDDGGAGGGGGDAAAQAAAAAAAQAAAADKKFTQDDLTRIATAESAKGKRAGAAEVAAELGMTVAEAKALIATATAANDAAKTEAQKATDAAAASKTASDALGVTAAATILASKVDRALLVAGVAPLGADGKENPQLAMAARLVDVPADADDAAITAAIAVVKVAAPTFFAPVVPKADTVPGTGPNQTRTTANPFGASGAAEAAKRFPPVKVA